MAAIDPLANPKGVVRLCELCQKPAYIQCCQCRVTFYCGREHQQVDFVGIHEKICQLLIPLRTPLPINSSEEQRQHSKQQQFMRQLHILKLTQTAGQKLLFESKYTEAIPAAMQSLRVAVELYGLASVELVPAYLILGRASIGLGNLDQAEEYLLQAQWTVLKTPECPNTIRHKLSRHLGLLYTAKSQFRHSRRQLAYDIYYASEEFGAHDVRTSGGYFHMAQVFDLQENVSVARSLYHQVVEIWQRHLSELVECRLNEDKSDKLTVSVKPVPEPLDEAQQAEAAQMLLFILEFDARQSTSSEQQHITNDHPDAAAAADDDDDDNANMAAAAAAGTDGSTMIGASESAASIAARVYYTLAMLHYLLHDNHKATEFGRKAVSASASLQNDEFSCKSVEFLKLCENVNASLA